MLDLGCLNAATSWNWGSVPEWLAAIGTLAAVWFAAATYRRSENAKRKSQARLVHALLRDDLAHYPAGSTVYLPEYGDFNDELMVKRPGLGGLTQDFAQVEFWTNTVELHNGSDEVISDVFGSVLSFGNPDEPIEHTHFGSLALRPNETSLHLVFFTSGPVGACAPPWQPKINFRDAAFVEWERTMGAPVLEAPFYTSLSLLQRVTSFPRSLLNRARMRTFPWQ